MITIEELSAYNRKLVDMNLKLRKDNEFLASVIKQRNKQIDELSARNNELLEENGLLKERFKRAKEILMKINKLIFIPSVLEIIL